MIKELNHIGLLTTNIGASKDFYVETLGGTIIRDFKDDQGSLYTYIQLALGVIELIRVPEDSANKGFVHVCYLIDDLKPLDDYHQYLAEKGYEFTLAPKSTAAGDGRLAFFNDHSGVSFELIERKENVRIRDLVNDKIEAFQYISINVTPDTALLCDKFYITDMDFKKSGQVRYELDADAIELSITEDAAALSKPLSHICFKVKNCSEMLGYLKSKNIQCSEITDCTKEGGCFCVTGPDGEQIEFTC